MILLIDNYDSFTYNLVQYIGSIEKDVTVIRNDEKEIAEIKKMNPKAIILSPGPGYPANAGICISLVKELGNQIPMLGVCLGHQAICEAFGAKIIHAKNLMHGKQSKIELACDTRIFKDIKSPTPAARYHSLAADIKTLPECLKIIAQTKDGEVMAVEHKKYPIYGLQFHPESILTKEGKKIMENFMNLVKEREE